MGIEGFKGTYERKEKDVSLEKDLFSLEKELAMQKTQIVTKENLSNLMANVEFDESNFEYAAYPHYDAEGVLV